MQHIIAGHFDRFVICSFLFRFDNAEAQSAESVAGVIMASFAYFAVVDAVARTASAEIAA